jgi:hypothetical protein
MTVLAESPVGYPLRKWLARTRPAAQDCTDQGNGPARESTRPREPSGRTAPGPSTTQAVVVAAMAIVGPRWLRGFSCGTWLTTGSMLRPVVE